MRQTLAILATVAISLLMAKPVAAAPDVTGVGDRLSLSITNKYGDILANPTVVQILGDGLVLQSGTMAMKVKYEDLPAEVSRKYQPLAAGIMQKAEKQDAANAAYFAYARQLQAEQAQHLAAQTAQEEEQAKEKAQGEAAGNPQLLNIAIPNQNWNLLIANLGFGEWNKQQDSNHFVLYSQPGSNSFNLVLIVETPANNLPGNDPVYNFYWANMANNSQIDPQTVKVEKRDKFIKVGYTAQNQPNVNYFFACHGQWVDVHLSKASLDAGDDKSFAAFDNDLSYGP